MLAPYQRVLGLPRVRSVLALSLAARVPMTAGGIVLTLYTVLGLHRSYAAAGLVGGLCTVGVAIGAPYMGRLVDARGLRVMLAVTGPCEALFWLSAPLLPFWALLVSGLVTGVVSLPAMSVGRQALAAVVPPEQRRAAFSMDSISVELSYMVGPAAGVAVATSISPTVAVEGLGVMMGLVAIVLAVVNPPMRAESEPAAGGARPPRRSWIGPRVLGLLLSLTGAVYALAGMEVAVVAALRSVGEVSLAGLVTIAMCLASIVGGLLYGASRRHVPVPLLVGGLGALLAPVGLAAGQWWVLALVLFPANMLCAPTISAANDEMVTAVPAAARGEALGLLASANTLGAALGSPVVGLFLDRTGVTSGFVAAGLGGLLLAGAAGALTLRATAAVRDDHAEKPPLAGLSA